MRKIGFPMKERAKLIPVDFIYGKYKLLMVLSAVFLLSGLDRTGFLFDKMAEKCLVPFINIFGAYVAGIVLTPLFLPWIPFRSFAFKGAFWGLVTTVVLSHILPTPLLETVSIGLINLSVSSFMAMNFTGSSTFTSLSGVQKEMKIAIPFQIGFLTGGFILFIVSKLI
jgi:hypothetical protein